MKKTGLFAAVICLMGCSASFHTEPAFDYYVDCTTKALILCNQTSNDPFYEIMDEACHTNAYVKAQGLNRLKVFM